MNFPCPTSKSIPLAILGLFAFFVAPTVTAQINNDIFSLTPKRYYSYGKKKPQYLEGMDQGLDSANAKQFDSAVNDYLIAKDEEEFEE